ITWLPTYLTEAHGLALDQNVLMHSLEGWLRGMFNRETTHKLLLATLAGVPLFFGGLGSSLCGLLTPLLVRASGSVTWARRALAVLGFSGAAGLLVWSFYIRDPRLAMFAMGLASWWNDLTMRGSWSICMAVGGRHAGRL